MSKIPHGEPYAGKLHVRFDEGGGRTLRGRLALLYTLGALYYVYKLFEKIKKGE